MKSTSKNNINKKVINAVNTEIDGYKFKSKLELNTYKLFKESNINFNPKPDKIILQESFNPTKDFLIYDKSTSSLVNNNSKVRAITYTPDFILKNNHITYYIETKGFKTDSYKIKSKLFRNKLEHLDNAVFVEINTLTQVKKLIEYVKSN